MVVADISGSETDMAHVNPAPIRRLERRQEAQTGPPSIACTRNKDVQRANDLGYFARRRSFPPVRAKDSSLFLLSLTKWEVSAPCLVCISGLRGVGRKGAFGS
jgi:hypothetical protein